MPCAFAGIHTESAWKKMCPTALCTEGVMRTAQRPLPFVRSACSISAKARRAFQRCVRPVQLGIFGRLCASVCQKGSPRGGFERWSLEYWNLEIGLGLEGLSRGALHFFSVCRQGLAASKESSKSGKKGYMFLCEWPTCSGWSSVWRRLRYAWYAFECNNSHDIHQNSHRHDHHDHDVTMITMINSAVTTWVLDLWGLLSVSFFFLGNI